MVINKTKIINKMDPTFFDLNRDILSSVKPYLSDIRLKNTFQTETITLKNGETKEVAARNADNLIHGELTLKQSNSYFLISYSFGTFSTYQLSEWLKDVLFNNGLNLRLGNMFIRYKHPNFNDTEESGFILRFDSCSVLLDPKFDEPLLTWIKDLIHWRVSNTILAKDEVEKFDAMVLIITNFIDSAPKDRKPIQEISSNHIIMYS